MTEQDRIEYFKNEISRLSNQVVDLLAERDQMKAQVAHLASLLEQSIPHIHSRKAKGKASYDFLVSVQKTVSKLRQQAKRGDL